MNDNLKQWLAWIIIALVTLAISLFFGIQYPIPEPPEAPIDLTAQAANFSNPIDIEGSSSASAPALTFEDDTDTGIFRSAANTLNIAAGGTEYLEIDSSALTFATTADIDAPLDVDTSGSIDLTSTEAAANAIHLDANGTVTTGIDVDLGSVSGMTIDGGLVNIGGASAGVADGDNDVAIAGVLEVDGETELDGALDADSTANFADTVTIAGGLLLPAADATAAFTATASNCGKTYFLNAATEFQTILPAVSTVSAGCTFQFICKAAPSGASYTILTGNSDEDVLIGGINELEVDTGDDGPYDASADTITFVDGTAVVGDYVYLFSDGTSWYVRGQANADGGITITDSD